MTQFDVFANPIAAMRPAYPFVVTLQADFAQNAPEQIVAPLVPRHAMPTIASRLTPVVAWEGAEYVALVPALAGMRTRDLTQRCCSVASARGELLAAIDHLFFGV